MRKLPALTVILLLTGCVVGPRYRPPAAIAPAHWSENRGASSSGEELRFFWSSFDDPTLSDLIERAIRNNYNLKIAGERIRVAYDLARVAAAGELPQIGIGAATENRRQTQTLDWPPASKYGEYPYYEVGLDASWEVDLFGAVRRRRESAQAAEGAAVEARRGIAVSLSAAVAGTYLSLRATGLRLQVARRNLEVARQAAKLAHHAFEAGECSHLDVSEAEGHLQAIRSLIPLLQGRADELTHALAILLARPPALFDTSGLHRNAPFPAPPSLPPSLPSEVIAQRPDIRRAEREYAQASAKVGVAVADLYPHFSIPLDIGSTSSAVRQIFQHASLLWRAGLDGSQSLYSGGRLTANVDEARAEQEATLLSYRETVLRAFGEVEDALSTQRAEDLHYEAVSAELADDRRALFEARERYGEGQVGFLPVLEAEQQSYATEDAQVQSSLNRCLADISLFKALGGDWQTIMLPNMVGHRPAGSAAESE